MVSVYMFICIVPSCLACSYLSDGLHTHRHTQKYICLFILMLHFWLAMIKDLPVTSARSLHVYRCTHSTYLPMHFDALHTYPKINLFNAFFSCYPTQRPTSWLSTLTAPLHAHRCTRSWPYQFILILSFWFTAKIYPSTFLLLYMSADIPVHQYTSLICHFWHTFQFIY